MSVEIVTVLYETHTIKIFFMTDRALVGRPVDCPTEEKKNSVKHY